MMSSKIRIGYKAFLNCITEMYNREQQKTYEGFVILHVFRVVLKQNVVILCAIVFLISLASKNVNYTRTKQEYIISFT